jgi:outer membrane lipoprotein carrier protein
MLQTGCAKRGFLAVAFILASSLALAEPSPTVSPSLEEKPIDLPAERMNKVIRTAPRPSPKPPAKKSGSTSKASPKSSQIKELPKLLSDVQVKYIRAGTLNAEFFQVNKTAAMNQSKTSSGTIMAKRPNKMRWETLKPDKNLLVSNGVTFWYYTPPFEEGERGQMIERKSSQVQSKLANALLSGSFSDLAEMKIKQSGKNEFTLTPRKGTAGTVVKAFLEIDAANSLIRRVKLVHSNGNESEISLQNIQLGNPIKDSLFEFEAPPNTERVN